MTHDALVLTRAATRGGRRRAAQRRARRSAVLTLASTIAPGAGLLPTRRRRAGAVVLGVFTVLVVVGTVYVVTHNGPFKAALAIGTNSTALLVIAVVTGLCGLLWTVVIVVTHRTTQPADRTFGHHRALRILTGVMCLIVLAPSVEIVRYALITRDTMGGVFGGSLPLRTSTDAVVEDPWSTKSRVNVFLLGSDAGPGRTGVRTDSMIVASIDTKTGDTVLIGIPRNLERAPIAKDNPLRALWPNGYDCGDVCLINALWVEAENHKDLFPNDPSPGLTTIRGTLEEVLGLHIDNTFIADLRGFQELVDAMGGVEINVLQDTAIYGPPPGYVTHEVIKAGRQVLDGYHALWYARSRRDSDDFSRMKRQRCVVGALVSQVNPVNLIRQYPALAKAVKNNILTDIPQDQLGDWAELVTRVQKSTVRSLSLTPENISVVHPDFDKIRALVKAALLPPKTTAKPSPTSSGTSTSSPTSRPSGTTAPGSPTDAVDLNDAC